MKIVCIGGGPAGLYFGILMKKADPAHEIRIIERNRHDDTFGFGVVFSDATLGNLAAADPDTYAAITEHFAHWDDIDTHIGGRVFRSTGHGFCGLSRKTLLLLLQDRCRALGVTLSFETEVDVTDLREFADADLIVAADGVGSRIREQFADAFEPSVDMRPNRFVWLGTTFPFEAFTFYFKESQHGLFRVHAYRYQQEGSTFIVECTEETWRQAGLDKTSEDETIAYLEEVFADELAGHRLIKNRSIWRQFPTVYNRRWHHDNIVLVGDAAHTAHFSIGSGTKLAMEDCIYLCQALNQPPDSAEQPDNASERLSAALQHYERTRRPDVERLQRAAQISLEWFENTERYMHLQPEQFAFSLLTRSLRVTHANLALRDGPLVAELDRAYAVQAAERAHGAEGAARARAAATTPPPMFTPWRARDMVVDNRVVGNSPSLDSAVDGVVGAAHLVRMGALAQGGAGLVMTESLAVAADGRYSDGGAGLYSSACAEGLQPIVAYLAGAGTRVGALLGHAGRRARGSTERVAASALPYRPDEPAPRAAEPADLARIVGQFVEATRRAATIGFHTLVIDMAGGGLLAGFLSSRSNRRTDDHGGSLANRLRWPIEVVAAVRAAWPSDRPLGARISATDWAPGSDPQSDSAEAVRSARALADAGCDYLEVTTGGNLSDEKPQVARLYQTQFADQIRNQARVATVAIDDVASYTDINSILAAGRADLCAPLRALWYAPNHIRHAAAAQNYPLPWPAALANLTDFRLRD